MPPKAADLPASTKQNVLSQIRDQIGSVQYDEFVNKWGEDNLIDFMLIAADNTTSSRSQTRTGSKANRPASSIAGLLLGLVIGGVFLGVSWLLNLLLGVPQWHGLATLINIASITLVMSLFLAEKKIDFRTVLVVYALVAFLGGLMGVGRWLFHVEFSLSSSLSGLGSFMSNCWQIIVVFGACAGFLLWVVSLGGISGSVVLDNIGPPVLLVFLIILVVAGGSVILIDSPLLTPWFSTDVASLALLVKNTPVVILILTAILGFLLGLLLPRRIQYA
jgi:hypothetical protein